MFVGEDYSTAIAPSMRDPSVQICDVFSFALTLFCRSCSESDGFCWLLGTSLFFSGRDTSISWVLDPVSVSWIV